MFCSSTCKTEANRLVNPTTVKAARHAGGLQAVVMSAKLCSARPLKLKRRTIFDFDFSNLDDVSKEEKLFECLIGLREYDVQDLPARDNFDKHFNTGAALCATMATLHKRSSSPMKYTEFPSGNCYREGEGISLFGALLNHSCDPNVMTIFVDNKLVFYAIKPIQEGDQLFISYG